MVEVGIWVGGMSARLRESVASGNEPYLATAPAVAVGGISRGGIVAHNRWLAVVGRVPGV